MGVYHDLEAIFHKINELYFANQITAKIVWGKRSPGAALRRSSIRLGSYDPNHRLITIHRALDQARVPRICVERVVHHEMLHQQYPARKERGRRRQIHTPEFKQAEALFLHAAAADRWFQENLNELLGKKIFLWP